MQESFFILYKEHIKFSTDELTAIVHSLDPDAQIQIISNLIIVNSKTKSDEIARRASFVRVTGQILKRDFQTELKKQDVEILDNKTFACRIINLSSETLDIPRIENEIGRKISRLTNGKVRLGSPELTIQVIVTEKEKILGISPPKINQKRPKKIHSHPHQLDWKLTRAMINLIGLKKGQTICDPFCGTGTTLLEAELLGLNGIGIDFDKKMWQKTRENIVANGYKSQVHNSDFKDLVKFTDQFDAIVTDLPYGRASKTSENPEKMLEKLLSLTPKNKRIAIMYKKTPDNGNIELQGFKVYEIYRHKSLTRTIVIK